MSTLTTPGKALGLVIPVVTNAGLALLLGLGAVFAGAITLAENLGHHAPRSA